MRNRRYPLLLRGLLSLGAVAIAGAGAPLSFAQSPAPPVAAVSVETIDLPPEADADTEASSDAGLPGDAGAGPVAGLAAEGAAADSDPGSERGGDTEDEIGNATPRPPPENWLETTAAIDDFVDAGDLEAALALRELLLELAAEQFGAESAGVAEAHMKIADLHRKNRDYEEAEAEFLLAIDAYRNATGPLSPDLIDPYLGLGDTYVESGAYRAGITAYSEARTIGRRNFGLLNPDQLEIIDDMADAAERLGETSEAQELQLDALTLVERNFSELSVEAIEARYKYAVWLRRHGLFEDERRIYYQIERVIRDEYNEDPAMTVRLLRERARSFRADDSGDGVGLGALSDALEIVEGMPDPPPLLHAQVLVDIGDWYVEFSRTRPFGDEYLRAWALLGEVEGGETLRREWFDALVEIEMASLSRRDLTTDPEAPQGHVVVYFTVDPAGRTQDVVITDSEPEGFKDAAVLRLIREAKFRPRIIDGKLVSARRAYRFEFRYIPPEEQ